jgi:tRNA A-37 threonylcarbamoyl transferase component Bud32
LADGRRLVLKKALPHGSLMALAARIAGPMPYLGVTMTERVQREADALARLAAEGVAVPRLHAADAEAGLIAMACVEGECLAGRADDAAVAARFGRTLAAVHRAGVALCDGHPGNAILEPGGRVVVIDLEWAAIGEAAHERRGFDLAYASAFLPGDASRAAFFRGYGRVTGVVRAQLEEAQGELAPFASLMKTERIAA